MTDYQEQHLQTHRRSVDPEDVFLYLIAFFFPPLPVAIRSGFWTKQLLLNVLLTMMFGLPGTLHSIYIIYITSPVTGDQARRVAYPDYERLPEGNDQTDTSTQTGPVYSDQAITGTSVIIEEQPPSYTPSDIHRATDNKVQLSS